MHPTRIFKAPEELEKAFEEYKVFLESEAKKWPKVQYVGKDGSRKVDYPVVPYTIEGFERFCYNNYGCVNQYMDNQDGNYNDFLIICSRVKREIREQQINGGLMGFYNPSITQRLNNLKESTEVTVKEQQLFPEE
jgi:hypothetical protein